MLVRVSDLVGKHVELRILSLRKDAPIYLQKEQKAILEASENALLTLTKVSVIKRTTTPFPGWLSTYPSPCFYIWFYCCPVTSISCIRSKDLCCTSFIYILMWIRWIYQTQKKRFFPGFFQKIISRFLKELATEIPSLFSSRYFIVDFLLIFH